MVVVMGVVMVGLVVVVMTVMVIATREPSMLIINRSFNRLRVIVLISSHICVIIIVINIVLKPRTRRSLNPLPPAHTTVSTTKLVF